MKPARLALAAFILASASPALAMDVEAFLVRVHALERLGPFAFFSRDFYRLKGLVEADGEQLKAEFAEAKAVGRPVSFCPPEKGKPRVNPKEGRSRRAAPLDHHQGRPEDGARTKISLPRLVEQAEREERQEEQAEGDDRESDQQ